MIKKPTFVALCGKRSQRSVGRASHESKRTLAVFLVAFLVALSIHGIVRAQAGQNAGGAGQNVNVITGSKDQFTGDKFRQRQNESMIGISSVNPAHMMVVYNDARTVDYPDDPSIGSQSPGQGFVAKVLDLFRAPWRRDRKRGWDADGPAAMPNQAWIGMSFSDNGGKSWYTGLHPGNYGVLIPADTDSMLADAILLRDYVAANDPVLSATHDEFFVGGIAFNLPSPNGNGRGIGFVSRFTDRNNTEKGQNIHFDGTKVLLKPCATDLTRLCTFSDLPVSAAGTSFFVDKPSIAAAPGASEGQSYVYVAFVIFDTSDPAKLSSRILFFSSTTSGAIWSGPVTISQPLTRNQAPWIVVDPNNPRTVYIGWRVFANPQNPSLTNAVVGRRSTDAGVTFTPSTPYGVAFALKAFDQPQGNLAGTSTTTPSLPIPRSAAYPSATIDGNGAIHVLMQEYVYPANYPTVSLQGRPLGSSVPVTVGVPRITVTTSFNQGATWTIRKAVDLANGAGTQFMPTITAVGEPGDSCVGKTGPSSRVIAMFYDARASGIGLTAPLPAGTYGYVTGGDKQFDVRIAQASACSANSLTGLTFSPSELVSQYARSSTAPFGVLTTDVRDGSPIQRTNRAYPMSCTGNCAFSGDYNHVTSRTGYVKVNSTWMLTTATNVNRSALPAPVVQAVWADTRDTVLPTSGTRSFLSVSPALDAVASPVDKLEWNKYAPPGTGLDPCSNPGSRDQNVYTAEYTPGGLFASAPVTFKNSSIPRAYPLYVENRTAQTRSYLLTIDSSANASFDYTSYDAHHNPLALTTKILIAAISSVTGSVIVGPNQSAPIPITIQETDGNGNVIPTGAKTTVVLNTSGADASTTEMYVPVIGQQPIVRKPFGIPGAPTSLIQGPGLVLPTAPATIPTPAPFSPNPFSPNPFGPDPFSPNPGPTPFSPNPFSPNPFSPNAFAPNPFSPNQFPANAFPTMVTVQDVTDISYVVTNAGEQTAAFNALTTIQNAPGTHVVQVFINRAVPTNTLIGCQAADTSQAVTISTFATPFSPNPFSPNPFSPNPFSPNPFSPNGAPVEFSNSTFYVKPAQASGVQPLNPAVNYVADPTTDASVITYRDFLIGLPGVGTPLSPQNIAVKIEAQVPNAVPCTDPVACPSGALYDPTGPPITGTQIPDHLDFIVQPSSAPAGATITPPVQAAIRDRFGATVTGVTQSVRVALGATPPGGTLSGTKTATVANGKLVSGVATFSDLSINNAGTGYTLIASSGALPTKTSSPFDVLAPPVLASCVPSSSLSALIQGNSVTSYVPKGSWSGATPGISLVQLEGTGIIATTFSTGTDVINSCASNSVTGQTVCTANNDMVYVLGGSTPQTFRSGGTGTLNFSGGSCTNCGVAINAATNQAVIALSGAKDGYGNGLAAFQFVDLSTSPPTFATPVLSQSPGGNRISEAMLIDPVRKLILSPSENSTYEIVNVASTTPAFYEYGVTPSSELDSAALDCTTGIALASVEFTNKLFIADLTQSMFTPGSPGSWTAPQQLQSFPEFYDPATGAGMGAGTSGIAVAPNSHIGLVTGEFGTNAFGVIKLPSTSGTGTPAVLDWLRCDVPDISAGAHWSMGFDPHTMTAYVSPANGHAMGLIANGTATNLAVIDLTRMLNNSVFDVARDLGGHTCASNADLVGKGIVRFITVP